VTVSGVLILVTLAVWVAWDVVAYLRGWQTESSWVRGLAKRPAIVFAAGMLIDHWFFTG
jgi:hypothetical protein